MFMQVNTFQCVLATNEFESFVLFLYNDGGIQWTTGDGINGLGVIDRLGGDGINGLGGNEATVGISSGDSYNYITVPSSQSPNVLNIDQTSNVGNPGVWMFKVGTGSL